MSGIQTTVVKKTIVLAIASALLMAVMFVLLDLFPGIVRDAILGTIVGASGSVVVCLMVSVMERELAQRERTETTSPTAGNVIIGVVTGVIVVATAVTLLVPAVDLTTVLSPSPIPWGVLVAALLGLPLGVLVGGLIGASWRWF